jgi:hypothetical protein
MTGDEIIAALDKFAETHYLTPAKIVDRYLSQEELDTVEAVTGPFHFVYQDRVGYDYDREQVVLLFEKHNVYIAADGHYSSWDGTDWSYAKWIEVEPVPAVVYEPVKR